MADIDRRGGAAVKVLVVWSRYGPYHKARLSAVQATGGAKYGLTVAGLEVASLDHYRWDANEGLEEPSRITLFPGSEYDSLTHGAIRSEVRRYLDMWKPDVVAVNGWGSPEARECLRWCRSSLGRKAIVMSETKADDLERYFWKELVKRRILRKVHAGLVGGRAQAEYLSQLGVSRDRIFLGYDAVDNQYFEIRSDRVRTQAKFVLEDPEGMIITPPYFFVCSRFIKRKNIDGLLRAYSIYLRRSMDSAWPLVIAGSGVEEDGLRDLATCLRIGSKVHWLGFVQYDDLPRWYSAAGAFVHPAKVEPWGLVVNEAAACALPLLVGNRVGAGYELVREGESGFTFDAGDDFSVANTMLRVARIGEQERTAMGRAARTAVSHFGLDRFVAGLAGAANAVDGSKGRAW